jgi:hypothetical protein
MTGLRQPIAQTTKKALIYARAHKSVLVPGAMPGAQKKKPGTLCRAFFFNQMAPGTRKALGAKAPGTINNRLINHPKLP